MELYAIPALFYVTAVLMPSWGWLGAYSLLTGALLLALYVAAGSSDLGAGGFVAIAVYFFAAACFACGVLIRAISLALAGHGRKYLAIAICVIGLPLPYVLIYGAAALETWGKRPAPLACLESGIPVQLRKAGLRVPAAPIFGFDTNGSASTPLATAVPAHMRELCSRTDNGAKPLRIALLSLHYQLHIIRDYCRDKPAKTLDTLCKALPRNATTLEETNLPVGLDLLVPEELNSKDFRWALRQIQHRTTGTARLLEGEFEITTDTIAPDQKPLTFICRQYTERLIPCTATYGLGYGVFAHYRFQSPREEIVERGKTTYHWCRT